MNPQNIILVICKTRVACVVRGTLPVLGIGTIGHTAFHVKQSQPATRPLPHAFSFLHLPGFYFKPCFMLLYV